MWTVDKSFLDLQAFSIMSTGFCVDMLIAVRNVMWLATLPSTFAWAAIILCILCIHTKPTKKKSGKNLIFMIFVLLLCYRHHIPDVRIFLVPKLHFEKESIVTLMLVNPVEKPTYIRMEALQDSDTATAKVGFKWNIDLSYTPRLSVIVFSVVYIFICLLINRLF